MNRLIVIGFLLLLIGCSAPATEEHGGHAGHTQPEKKSAEREATPHGAHHGAPEKMQPTDEGASVRAAFSFSVSPQAMVPVSLTMTLTDAAGKPVTDLTTFHEKKVHLILIRNDVRTFEHVHPVMSSPGVWEQEVVFPTAGTYRLFADIQPARSHAVTLDHTVTVAEAPQGKQEMTVAPLDQALQRTVDGVTVTLSKNMYDRAKSNELVLTVTDAVTQKPLQTIEPYLGAIGHMVILSTDTQQYLHVHPVEKNESGPQATFVTTFPQAGSYQVWVQFQVQGVVRTFPFSIQVRDSSSVPS